jgi:hypothetical protein
MSDRNAIASLQSVNKLFTTKLQTAKPKKTNGICHTMKFKWGWIYECDLKITNHDKGARMENQVAEIKAARLRFSSSLGLLSLKKKSRPDIMMNNHISRI